MRCRSVLLFVVVAQLCALLYLFSRQSGEVTFMSPWASVDSSAEGPINEEKSDADVTLVDGVVIEFKPIPQPKPVTAGSTTAAPITSSSDTLDLIQTTPGKDDKIAVGTPTASPIPQQPSSTEMSDPPATHVTPKSNAAVAIQWGKNEKIVSHPNGDCESFGYGRLHTWLSELKPYCSPEGDSPTMARSGSKLECGSHVFDYMPQPTGPHAFCGATNVRMTMSAVHPAPCVRHRGDYFCGDNTYLNYDKGAFQGMCTKAGDFRIDDFPRDHLRDIFDSWTTTTDGFSGDEIVFDAPVVFVTRERGEHVNIFHTMSDFLSAFEILTMSGMRDDRSVEVFILDEHKPGPFDRVWSELIGAKLHRSSGYAGKKLFMRQALYSPPGYSQTMLINNHAFSRLTNACGSRGTELFRDFREWFVKRAKAVWDIHPREELVKHENMLQRVTSASDGSPVLRVTVITRRPYNRFIEHSTIGRQTDNDGDIMAMLEKQPGVEVVLVDLAQIDFEDQVALAVSTDVLIGMHGAGLALMTLTPPHAGVVEMWPKTHWRCFEMLAALSGKVYQRWQNHDAGAFRELSGGGDITRVNVGELQKSFEHVAREVRSRMSTKDV